MQNIFPYSLCEYKILVGAYFSKDNLSRYFWRDKLSYNQYISKPR